MSVDIEPLQLSFQRPFTQEVSQTLTVFNQNTTPVAFKVKTTAPKRYCVRPNAGRIEPGQSFDVSVLLQAMKEEPPADTKCRDKFLVQSAPITGDKEFDSIASVFEMTDKSSINERRIRVNWLPAAGDEAPPAIAVTPNKRSSVNGRATETPEGTRTFASPSADVDSPRISEPPPYTDDGKTDPEDVKLESPKSASSVAAVSSGAKSVYESVKEKADPTATASTVRQRVKSATAGAQETGGQLARAVPHNVQGVPVKITALLCFLAFLVGYFFF